MKYLLGALLLCAVLIAGLPRSVQANQVCTGSTATFTCPATPAPGDLIVGVGYNATISDYCTFTDSKSNTLGTVVQSSAGGTAGLNIAAESFPSGASNVFTVGATAATCGYTLSAIYDITDVSTTVLNDAATTASGNNTLAFGTNTLAIGGFSVCGGIGPGVSSLTTTIGGASTTGTATIWTYQTSLLQYSATYNCVVTYTTCTVNCLAIAASWAPAASSPGVNQIGTGQVGYERWLFERLIHVGYERWLLERLIHV